jgi:sialidase-1
MYSDDHGATWYTGGTVGPDTSEATAVQLADGNVMINMRNHRGGKPMKRAVSITTNEGEIWGPIWDEDQLVEPRCQASIIRFTDKPTHRRNRILFSNAADLQRVNMTVKVSYDEGQT